MPLLGEGGEGIDLRRFAAGGVVLLAFARPSGTEGCEAFLDAVAAVACEEPEAELLVVTPARADLERQGAGWTVGYDEGGRLATLYRGLMEVDSAGQAMLFALDRDGAPAYAWVGSCDAMERPGAELARRLQSAAFLCPECSVPEPGASARWEAVY